MIGQPSKVSLDIVAVLVQVFAEVLL